MRHPPRNTAPFPCVARCGGAADAAGVGGAEERALEDDEDDTIGALAARAEAAPEAAIRILFAWEDAWTGAEFADGTTARAGAGEAAASPPCVTAGAAFAAAAASPPFVPMTATASACCVECAGTAVTAGAAGGCSGRSASAASACGVAGSPAAASDCAVADAAAGVLAAAVDDVALGVAGRNGTVGAAAPPGSDTVCTLPTRAVTAPEAGEGVWIAWEDAWTGAGVEDGAPERGGAGEAAASPPCVTGAGLAPSGAVVAGEADRSAVAATTDDARGVAAIFGTSDRGVCGAGDTERCAH